MILQKMQSIGSLSARGHSFRRHTIIERAAKKDVSHA
jgi:hypothetical protein